MACMYIEIELPPDVEEEDEGELQEVNVMLKKCDSHYGDEFSARFRRILDAIKQMKRQFHDIYALYQFHYKFYIIFEYY